MRKTVVNMLYLALMIFLGSSVYAQEIEFLKGFKIGGGITLVLQNLQNSNMAIGKSGEPIEPNKTPTLGQYSLDLTIEKTFNDDNVAFIHFETGKGNINYYLESVAGINRDADDSDVVRVTEAWFKHRLTNKFAVTTGILDPTTSVDENAYANDETKQFIGSMFRNAINILFPDNAFGVKADYETKVADFAVQYIDASKYKDITRNGFVSAQVNFKPGIIDEMEGNYRVYGWLETNDYSKLNDKTKMAGKEKNYGLGLSLDQQFTDIFSGFARYSWSRGDIIDGIYVSNTWSIGLQATVKGFGNEDVVAIACGQVIPSKNYKDYINEKAKSENHLEVYYRWNVTDYLAISPDFQMVENPFYNEQYNTAYVGTMRMQISF